MQSISNILHKNFQEDHTNSRFPGVVDTLMIAAVIEPVGQKMNWSVSCSASGGDDSVGTCTTELRFSCEWPRVLWKPAGSFRTSGLVTSRMYAWFHCVGSWHVTLTGDHYPQGNKSTSFCCFYCLFNVIMGQWIFPVINVMCRELALRTRETRPAACRVPYSHVQLSCGPGQV